MIFNIHPFFIFNYTVFQIFCNVYRFVKFSVISFLSSTVYVSSMELILSNSFFLSLFIISRCPLRLNTLNIILPVACSPSTGKDFFRPYIIRSYKYLTLDCKSKNALSLESSSNFLL